MDKFIRAKSQHLKTAGINPFEIIPDDLSDQLELHFDVLDNAHELYQNLKTDIEWNQREIRMFGKTHLEPRLVAWYGDPAARYVYSGIENVPLSWTPDLIRIKSYVEKVAGTHFNSVLLNLYRDGNDSMGYHSDDEPELGRESVIASLSLGSDRKFNMRNKESGRLVSMNLPNNSLLIMKGKFQEEWRHAVPKTKKVVGERINLTFRKIHHQ